MFDLHTFNPQIEPILPRSLTKQRFLTSLPPVNVTDATLVHNVHSPRIAVTSLNIFQLFTSRRFPSGFLHPSQTALHLEWTDLLVIKMCITQYVLTLQLGIFVSSACVYTAELQSWRRRVRRPSVRPSSVNSGFSKPLHGSRPYFVGSSLSTISPDHFVFFQNFQFLNFYIFFLFSSTWNPMGAKISKKKRYTSSSFASDLSQTLW